MKKKVSSPHYLKILVKLSKHGISYSLKCDPRSSSKITFYANLTLLISSNDFFKELQYLHRMKSYPTDFIQDKVLLT